MTSEQGQPGDPQPEESAAADHQKVHHGTLAHGGRSGDQGAVRACLCTPLAGPDLAARLPRYRPTSLLARETNGDLGDVLLVWRDRLRAERGDAGLRALSRSVGRRTVRTGFTLVMPRWGGWTSDLDESAAVFSRYYPARAIRALAGRRRW